MRRDIRPGRFGEKPESPDSLAGSLLLAHPALTDAHFRRSVILLAANNAKDGSMGVILNRPLKKTLMQADTALATSAIGPVPLYEGGPVERERAIFAGWNWDDTHRSFRIHFGIEREAAENLRRESPDAALRIFVGYAGWTPGQLEGELTSPTWIVSKIEPALLDSLDGTALWRALVKKAAPDLALAADAPDAPEFN